MSTTHPTDAATDAPIDGRTARAVRTKDAIVSACLALIDGGDLRPTAPRIAERAGVSVRSVFQHFDDLDALFMAVGEKVAERTGAIAVEIDVSLPIDARIGAFAAQRAEVLEGLSPVLQAAIAHAATSPVIQRQFDDGHRFLRDQVTATFAAELERSSDPSTLGHALLVACSWPAWNVLRAAQGLSADEAESVLRWHLTTLLGRATPS